MARFTRCINGFLVVIGICLFAGCTNSSRNGSVFDPPNLGLPVAQTNLSGPETEKPVFRSQQPTLPPVGQKVNRTANSSDSDLPPSMIAEKYQVRICAWVNGKPIFKRELLNRSLAELMNINKMAEPSRSAKRKKVLEKNLKHLIDQELVYQDAYGKLSGSPVFMKKLKDAANKIWSRRLAKMQKDSGKNRLELNQLLQLQQGTSLESLRIRDEKAFFVSEYLRSRIHPFLDQISPYDIREYYETHQNEFQTVDSVEWEDLFVASGKYSSPSKARQMADYLASRLRAGEPIGNLLKYDDGLSSTNKGRGFGKRKGEIRPPQLEPYLFQMKPGEVGPVIELPTGFHVFRLVHRDYAGILPLNADVQKKIRKKLSREISDREYDRIIRQLSEQAVIEVDPEAIGY